MSYIIVLIPIYISYKSYNWHMNTTSLHQTWISTTATLYDMEHVRCKKDDAYEITDEQDHNA